MMHKAHMDNRNLICAGYAVQDRYLSEADRAWAMSSNVIRQNNRGEWFHTLITDRDRQQRADYWAPDTGPWRKGLNY